MKKITRQQFWDLLLTLKGATFATLTLSTEPSNMRKGGNPFAGLVRKVAVHNVCLNYSYENVVNNQRKREDKDADFKAGQTWGEHVSPCCIELDTKRYVQAKLQKSLSTTFVNQIDGSIINEAELAPYMREKTPNTNQGVDKEIINIRPKLENIIAANILGESYEIVP